MNNVHHVNFSKNVFKTGEMLIMLIMLTNTIDISLFSAFLEKDMLKTGEMVIMLPIFLYLRFWGSLP